MYSRIAVPAKRTSLKYGGDSPLATESSRGTNATNAGSAPLLACKLGMIWVKPAGGVLPNKLNAFLRAAAFVDGSECALFAAAHLNAMPSVDWISATSTWSRRFERTSR